MWVFNAVLVGKPQIALFGQTLVSGLISTISSYAGRWANLRNIDLDNYALTIPFTQPLTNVNWSSLSYTATKLPKAVPLTTRGVLWRNKEGNEFYKFAGGTNANVSAVNYSNDTIGPTEIWKFNTDSSSWSALFSAPSTDWDLQYCSVPALDKSFAFGSWSGDSTQSSMMVLDSAQSPEVSTRMDSAFTPAGVYEKGAIMHLPVKTGDGVLLFIGGSVVPASGPVPGNPDVSIFRANTFAVNDGLANFEISIGSYEFRLYI